MNTLTTETRPTLVPERPRQEYAVREPAPNRLPEIIPPAQPPSLQDLTVEIQKAHGKAMHALAASAAFAIEAGEALLQAKALLKKQSGHGSWEDYIAVECRLGVRTAQIYMFLAKHKDKLSQLLAANPNANSVLTQTQALRLLSAARKKRRGLIRKSTTNETNSGSRAAPSK